MLAAVFGRYLVRKDCHIQVQRNFYSVPYTLVGTDVTVRRSEARIDVFAAGECAAVQDNDRLPQLAKLISRRDAGNSRSDNDGVTLIVVLQ